MTTAAATKEGTTTVKTIRIAKGLDLPLDAVTQTVAILARKGSGKTFTARRFAEQLFKAGLQVVDVDPKGDHWGMRSSSDAKGPGLGFLILGGEHGDLPLEPGSGELVAKLVVEERVSVILDLSLFRKHEVATFMTAFLENLYRLKAREAYRTPVMLLVDEADAVAPQKPQPGELRMLGAIEDIVRRGRQRGIGCTLVTQRSAVLNKNVLTQAQVMVAMRTIAPQDLAAMDSWIDVHGTVEQRAALMESLPSLPRGDAWFWSPGWPTDEGIFQRVHVDPIETFDSGATPKPGEKRVEPKQRADVDLEALRRQMAATIERANAADPALLRKRIAELERELARKPAAAPPAPAKVERVEVPVLKEADWKRLEKVTARLGEVSAAAADLVRQLAPALRAGPGPRGGPPLAAVPRLAAPAPAPRRPIAAAPPPRAAAPRPATGAPAPAGELGKGERAILTAAAQHAAGVTREQLTVLTGYRRSSRDTYLQRLRAAGLVLEDERITATDAGVAELGPDFEPLPTGAALLEHWRTRLPQGERAVLEVLVTAYPDAVDRDAITEATSYQRSSRDTYLQRLRSRQLITEPARGTVRAADMLFER
jgi:uncharacterized protein